MYARRVRQQGIGLRVCFRFRIRQLGGRDAMSIQTRFLLALGLLLVASIVVLSLAVLTWTAPRIVQWEAAQARAEVARVRRALDRELEHLGIYAREWAVWDDSYRFVQAPYPEYVEANLGLASFNAARVDLLAYIRDGGIIAWAGFRDGASIDAEQGMRLAEALRPRAQVALRHRRGIGGIMDSGRGLIVVAAHPIRDSQELGPARGVMLAGRLLDDEFMQRLRRQIGVDLDIAPLADLPRLLGGLPPNVADELPADGSPLVRAVSASQLGLLARIPDMAGRPSVVLRINLSRSVFTQGRQLLTYTLLGTAALFLMTLAVAALLLRQMVFKPIADLARHAFELHHSGDYSRRLNDPRSDEIGKLAREFDGLLEQIHARSEELKRLSFEDALTGLRNRRYFDEQLRAVWAVLQRTGQPLSLLVLDVDEFKRYNDHYGHQQGDETLRAVAATLKRVLRRTVDTVARYGGEEFAAILPGTSRADAELLAEHVRSAVAELALPHAWSSVAGVVTISIGVASVEAGVDLSADAVLRMADEALYAAKRSGRNRVHVARGKVLVMPAMQTA
jgi:diguanylate cyclase (GGDEF)-like protein